MVLEKKEKLKELLVFVCAICETDYPIDNGYYHLEVVTSSGSKEHNVYFCSADCLALWLKRTKNPMLLVTITES